MYRMIFRAAALAVVLFLSGRSAQAESPVTFNNQVVRIFQQHCQTCHRPGNIAPFSLMSYGEARTHAFEIQHSVQSREMPPWKPINAHGVFEGERTLTDSQIQTISDWVAQGAPEGAANDLPEPITFPETWGAGTPDTVVQPPTS